MHVKRIRRPTQTLSSWQAGSYDQLAQLRSKSASIRSRYRKQVTAKENMVCIGCIGDTCYEWAKDSDLKGGLLFDC